MAVLQKIRNRAGLLVGALGFALLAFVLSDFFTSGNTWLNKFKDKAFVVDGDVVSTQKYFDRVAEFESFQKLISGQNSLDENVSAQIKEYVYEQMVKEMMLDDQAGKLGLVVSKQEMNDMVYGDYISPVLQQLPMFVDPQTRQFNRQALLEFLDVIKKDITTIPNEQKEYVSNLKSIWLVIENMMKYQRLEEKYNALLASAISVNKLDIKTSIDDSKSVADIAYVLYDYKTIADSTVLVTDDEVKKLYNQRKENFKLPTELRKISYFTKDVVPSEEDYAVIENEMKTVYNKMLTTDNPALVVADYSEFPYQDIFFSLSSLSPEEKGFVQGASIGDIYGPIRDNESFRLYKLIDKTMAADSVKLQMIVLAEGEDKQSSNAKADSIISVIKGGKDFAVVANEIEPRSNGGEVGWATEAMLTSAGDEFTKKIYGSAKGDVVKLNIRGQIQIVKIQDKTQPVPKVKLALVQIPVVVSSKTLNAIDNEVNQFVAENGNAENFVKAATNKGYNIVSKVMISPSEMGLAQIGNSRQIIHWAFNEKVGSVKNFELSDKRVVSIIDEEIKKGYLPVADVSSALKAELIKDRKAEKMLADLKSKNATSLDAYAQAINSKIDTVKFVNFETPNISGIGRESVLNVYSKLGQVSKLEGPIKGDNGVLVLTVQNRTDQMSDLNPEVVKQTASQRNVYRLRSLAMEVLKQKMNVEDNRVRFF